MVIVFFCIYLSERPQAFVDIFAPAFEINIKTPQKVIQLVTVLQCQSLITWLTNVIIRKVTTWHVWRQALLREGTFMKPSLPEDTMNIFVLLIHSMNILSLLKHTLFPYLRHIFYLLYVTSKNVSTYVVNSVFSSMYNPYWYTLHFHYYV